MSCRTCGASRWPCYGRAAFDPGDLGAGCAPVAAVEQPLLLFAGCDECSAIYLETWQHDGLWFQGYPQLIPLLIALLGREKLAERPSITRKTLNPALLGNFRQNREQ